MRKLEVNSISIGGLMSTIKVDSDTLLVLANDIYNFKDGLSRFALDVGKIEDRIALIVDGNVYKLKNELADLMNCTYLFSREFENLAEGLHYASIEYQDADKRIKDSIGSMDKLHMNDIASLIKNGVGIPLPLFIPNEYADYEEYLVSEDEAKEYFTMGVLGTGIVDGLKAKTMPARIAYKKDGHLYIYALCKAPQIDPIFGREIEIPHDGLDSKIVEQITNYKYQQVYTNEPKIERLDGVILFDGGIPKNMGKTYKGVGTVVEISPINKISGIYTGNVKDPGHFINRVIERGLSPELIINTFKSPRVVLSQWNGQRFRYISDDACIAINKDGEIITGWLKNEYGESIKQILKETK